MTRRNGPHSVLLRPPSVHKRWGHWTACLSAPAEADTLPPRRRHTTALSPRRDSATRAGCGCVTSPSPPPRTPPLLLSRPLPLAAARPPPASRSLRPLLVTDRRWPGATLLLASPPWHPPPLPSSLLLLRLHPAAVLYRRPVPTASWRCWRAGLPDCGAPVSSPPGVLLSPWRGPTRAPAALAATLLPSSPVHADFLWRAFPPRASRSAPWNRSDGALVPAAAPSAFLGWFVRWRRQYPHRRRPRPTR